MDVHFLDMLPPTNEKRPWRSGGPVSNIGGPASGHPVPSADNFSAVVCVRITREPIINHDAYSWLGSAIIKTLETRLFTVTHYIRSFNAFPP